jgi:hypothetical protein
MVADEYQALANSLCLMQEQYQQPMASVANALKGHGMRSLKATFKDFGISRSTIQDGEFGIGLLVSKVFRFLSLSPLSRIIS